MGARPARACQRARPGRAPPGRALRKLWPFGGLILLAGRPARAQPGESLPGVADPSGQAAGPTRPARRRSRAAGRGIGSGRHASKLIRPTAGGFGPPLGQFGSPRPGSWSLRWPAKL